ncbi:hypothetical protein EW145_g3202 [Phellinidium pouzarii]|uniref:Dynactin subunit 4 n=1 Tax=Phellinidium pouzarii TaxID=167371 RepID=A0A4S4L8E4_9AGAM|nr:hypothetical protein EW145_g3202 [Phellinidium pouzarii]
MSAAPVPPPPNLPSSSASFHPLHTLYFCEECDAVRCNRCVAIEVSGYYCPNCLFEVPSASVRAERNRWDSAEVGITFEKPTGLAQQLQKFEDSAPEFLEFERLKDFFEPLVRATSSSHGPGNTSHSTHVNALTTAASSALARDIPGVSKGSKDDLPVYRARVEVSGASGLGAGGDGDADIMRHLESPADVSGLEQRWLSSWAEPLHARELKPIRIPLHSRLTKRCPACRHILIKPEQKAQSVRYKIKLVAANYLPAISVNLPISQTTRKSMSIAQKEDDGSTGKSTMIAGKTYPFQLSMTNPLYDPIQVRLAVQRQQLSAADEVGPGSNVEADNAKLRRPPFAVTLPSTAFSVAAFAEAWEYEDDEEMFGVDDDELLVRTGNGASPSKERSARGKVKTVGVLEKKANTTVIGGEVVLSRDGRGDVKFNMLVSYTYRSDEPQDDNEGDPKARSTAKAVPEMKTFSFYTVVNLGMIVPKEDLTSAANAMEM